jgi:hypothetical protein
VHGDVSPWNIIVEGSKVTLIDYDLVTKFGEAPAANGTPPYASPNLRDQKPVHPADDLFALAATLFYVLTEREPFLFDGIRAVNRGLSWPQQLTESLPRLTRFLDRAVSLDPHQNFPDAVEAQAFLHRLAGGPEVLRPPSQPRHQLPLTANQVPWLKEILSAYPGSRYGNLETRGLDSEFSERTYVETPLDTMLCAEVLSGAVALVILCGNAGDGKTAFLQHLSTKLGLPRFPSSERVWGVTLSNGIKVKANLDGAASWQGRSADQLLDELFEPFHAGRPAARIVHLVAVNDGRLMEWIEGYERRHGATRLTEQIADRLAEQTTTLDSHVRLIELNLRSLVGGFDADSKFSSAFLENLITQIIGGAEASRVWEPCINCSAQSRCTAWRSARFLGVSHDQADRQQGELLRARLGEALQIVHQRNEVHITMRELKAALAYILFGTLYCTELHSDPNKDQETPWDLAFDPASPLRQGELLRELARLDPALEAHPLIDRYLLGHGGPDPEHGALRYPDLSLKSARRRAYFEWTEPQIKAVGGSADALGLAGAAHFKPFRDFPILEATEQQEVCRDLCVGISRLEDLPPITMKRAGVVPVRIVPRTPTETTFWAEREFDCFSLGAEAFSAMPGFETLHRHLVLRYLAPGGRGETLLIPFELFALLMDLKGGLQLVDTMSDNIFANLGVFTQRLAQENECQLLAWNPVDEELVYELSIHPSDRGQEIRIRNLTAQ